MAGAAWTRIVPPGIGTLGPQIARSQDSQPAAASLDTGHSKTAFYINYFCQTFGWAAQEKFKLTANSIAGQRYKNPTFKVTKFFALTRKLFNITRTTTDK